MLLVDLLAVFKDQFLIPNPKFLPLPQLPTELSILWQHRVGKSGQHRTMHRLSAGFRPRVETESATENNCPDPSDRDEGENVG